MSALYYYYYYLLRLLLPADRRRVTNLKVRDRLRRWVHDTWSGPAIYQQSCSEPQVSVAVVAATILAVVVTLVVVVVVVAQ